MYQDENDLIREMMKQGEFSCLSDMTAAQNSRKRGEYIVEWWCRKTDKIYSSFGQSLWDVLCDILEQARIDTKPRVTEKECNETAKRYGIDIYIPEPRPRPHT